MSAGSKTLVRVGSHTLALSNLEKVLWPRDGYTKGDLIAYYRSVARWLVPHLRDRPLTLQRWPDGIGGESFFEKQAPRGAPPWVRTVRLPSSSSRRSTIDYVVCDDEATLVWCANLAAIVLHAWTSRVASLDRPDYVLFDLDPWEGCTLKTMAAVALALREILEQVGLHPLVKTSGSSGMHVVVALQPQYGYDTVKLFAELTARRLAGLLPNATTLERMTAKRPRGTVYLDYVQVGSGKTVVPPYVVRARDGAPVSMPLQWEEVERLARKRGGAPEDASSLWTIANATGRLERLGDLWAGRAWRRARLEPALVKARTRWV